MDTERDEINEAEVDKLPIAYTGSPRRAIAIGALVLALIGIVFVIWFTLIRDDNSGTTAEVSVSGNQTEGDGGVEILQNPSLDATATIDGVPADGTISPIALTFGEPSELVVTVVNDGNLTMDDITVAIEITADDASDTEGPDPCALPVLAPKDSAVCTLEFTPTSSMSAVVARILGYGPQRQEVELTVNIALGS
jgi:hypothetical protein